MKYGKLLLMLIISLWCVSAYGADEWSKEEPLGTRNVSDIDYYVGINNEALDRLLTNYRENCAIYYISTSSVGIRAGEVVCSNSDGSIRKFRSNTAVVALTWANIDTGSEAASTTYYIYAVADADATTFTGTISTSATAPTGKTYYKLLGSFYNDGSSNILNDDSLINYDNYYALRLGDWVAKSNNTVYQASTDGFVVGYASGASDSAVYTDASNPPTTLRSYIDDDTYSSGFCVPVKKNDYYKATNTSALYWIGNEKEI